MGDNLNTGEAGCGKEQVNGLDIHWASVGDGKPVLMMHGGLGLSHGYFRPHFDRLGDSHKVVYYDHMGHGLSGRPDDYADMNFDRLVSDAAELMTKLGHERFTLIGHSYGGFIAQKFAAKHQDRLDGLVLLTTAPAFDYQPTVSGNEEQMAAFGKLFSEPMADDADWKATWNLVIQMYFRDLDPETGADLDSRTIYNHKAWNAGAGLLGSYSMLEDLPNIKTQTLVIGGRHDPITVAEQSERIAGLMPNAEAVIFEESAHYPFIEEQEAFFGKLKGWLTR